MIMMTTKNLRPRCGDDILFQTLHQNDFCDTKPKNTEIKGAKNKSKPYTDDIDYKQKDKIIRYSYDFLMKFAHSCTKIPPELDKYMESNVLSRNRVMGYDKGSLNNSDNIIENFKTKINIFTKESYVTTRDYSESSNAEMTTTQNKLEKKSSNLLEKNVRAIRSLLNKITLSNLERLLNAIIKEITSVELLKETARLLVEKAITEPPSSSLGAKSCLFLSTKLQSWPAETPETKPLSFKRFLLNDCNDGFNEIFESETLPSNFIKRDHNLKQRAIGIVRLVAEMHINNIIPKSILNSIVSKLISIDVHNINHEISVDVLCELYAVIIRHEHSEKSTENVILLSLLKKLKNLEKTQEVTSQVRFRIRNFLNLHKNSFRHLFSNST
eukprot:gnl/TRDRNA2_/TRDRNA2_177561_c2_seq1.p1 gnl/TRDRNA2_/TRDRNA2_177561_c2~~gnl/TRDRNA2_/TRDRNA2_177561_c2_seq1.p1  ORF type:complete len:384 (+),score=-15.40 gnl/TRDRNA2_/TRDRNA2_177561_c2_seq1:795-1946(+)